MITDNSMKPAMTSGAGLTEAASVRRLRPAGIFLVLGSVLMISACANQGRETSMTTETSSVTIANQANEKADRALEQSQRAMQMAQQAQAAAGATTERSDRMYQRSLRK